MCGSVCRPVLVAISCFGPLAPSFVAALTPMPTVLVHSTLSEGYFLKFRRSSKCSFSYEFLSNCLRRGKDNGEGKAIGFGVPCDGGLWISRSACGGVPSVAFGCHRRNWRDDPPRIEQSGKSLPVFIAVRKWWASVWANVSVQARWASVWATKLPRV